MDPLEALRTALEAATNALHERNTELDEAHRAVTEAPDDIEHEVLEERELAFKTACEAFDEADAELTRVKANLADAERRDRAIRENPQPAQARGTGRAESVYRPDLRDRSFFTDAYRMQFQFDTAARERIEQHTREMLDSGVQLRDVTSSSLGGLVVPQYLVDLYAPYAKAGSPLLNVLRKLPLPASGLTLNISRVTTQTTVGPMSTETAAPSETDIDDTLLPVNVRAYAGIQDISRIGLERGEMFDAVVYQDLIGSYYTALDAGIISDDGTGGTHLGILQTPSINATTYTDGSPTVAELYPRLALAIAKIPNTLFRQATTIVMSPLRWGWLCASLDDAKRPFVVPTAQGPFNAMAVGDAADYGNVVGTAAGLPVITDANLPANLGGSTNQDPILVIRAPELMFWQDGDGSPRQFRFDETAGAPQLVRLAVFGYSAFTAGRYPKAVSTITGTGLADPSALFV